MAESASHARFAILNHTMNPIVATVLRSPAHGLLSGRLALITVTGRVSGREYTIPVLYERDGDMVRIRVGGEDRVGHAIARGDEASGVTVEVTRAG